MNDYLSMHELAELIGCKPNQRSAMMKWLDANRWRYVVDSHGQPKVARGVPRQEDGHRREQQQHQQI